MSRLTGHYLRSLITIYDEKLVKSPFGRFPIDNEIRLREAYNRCVHGNLIDLRLPFHALVESRNTLADFAEGLPNFPFV